MQEQYALLWLATAFVLLLLAVWHGLLTRLSGWAGIHYPPSALFAAAIGLVIVLLLHFSVSVSQLKDRNKVLAQQVGLLKDRLAAQEQRLDAVQAKVDQDGAVDQAQSELTNADLAGR